MVWTRTVSGLFSVFSYAFSSADRFSCLRRPCSAGQAEKSCGSSRPLFTAAFFSVRPVSPIRNEGSIAESSFAAHGAFPLFWPCSETIWPTEALMQSASFRFFSLQGQETPGSDLLPVHPESQPAQNRDRCLWFTFHPCLHRNGFHASQTGLSCTAFMVMFLLGVSLSVRKWQRPFSMGGHADRFLPKKRFLCLLPPQTIPDWQHVNTKL